MKLLISVNGEKREIPAGLTIDQLLEGLAIRPGHVVVELNRNIISREEYRSVILKEGDTLEIVHFVGGG